MTSAVALIEEDVEKELELPHIRGSVFLWLRWSPLRDENLHDVSVYAYACVVVKFCTLVALLYLHMCASWNYNAWLLSVLLKTCITIP